MFVVVVANNVDGCDWGVNGVGQSDFRCNINDGDDGGGVCDCVVVFVVNLFDCHN